MSAMHKLAIAVANVVALLLVAGALFGASVNLSELGLDVDRSLRVASVSLWAIAVPGWFLLEKALWPPKKEDLEGFVARQGKAQIWWTLLGAAIFVGVLGLS